MSNCDEGITATGGDKRHRHNTGLQRSGGRDKLPVPYDLWRFHLIYAIHNTEWRGNRFGHLGAEEDMAKRGLL